MAKAMKNYKVKLTAGEHQFAQQDLALMIVGDGRLTYLWTGNDEKHDGYCFATISGEARLRKFAKELLRRLNVRKRKVR